jgi:hypothetical protein
MRTWIIYTWLLFDKTAKLTYLWRIGEMGACVVLGIAEGAMTVSSNSVKIVVVVVVVGLRSFCPPVLTIRVVSVSSY